MLFYAVRETRLLMYECQVFVIDFKGQLKKQLVQVHI